MIVYRYKPEHASPVIMRTLDDVIEQLRMDTNGDGGWLDEDGHTVIIQAVEMTTEELDALPTFEGW